MRIEVKSVGACEISKLTSEGVNGKFIAETRYSVRATDDEGNSCIAYIEKEVLGRLGIAYIEEHSELEYSDLCKQYFLRFSQNDWYNDPVRHPPKTVDVRFVECKCGEDTEVWQNVDNGSYYLRMLCREPFARWMTCGNRLTGWIDNNMIRPNITFRNGKQIETVTYDDWNGTAAYSSTFNPNFREKRS